MLYHGIDLHKQYSVIATMNAEGELLRRERVDNRPELLMQYFNNLDDSFKSKQKHKCLIEATFAWGWITDLLEHNKIEPMLAHPQKTKAIASARIKTDTVDATTLAHLLRTDLVAEAHASNSNQRDQQEILRTRAKLVMSRTQLKNKLHSILHKHNLNPRWDNKQFSDLFGKAGRKWLESKKAKLPQYTQFSFEQILNSIDHFTDQIKIFDKQIKEAWEQDDMAKLLQELPGIGYYGSLILSSEIGNISRFKYPDKLCSYAGLVPSVYQSGDKQRMGRIKKGNKYIRWILIEAVPKAIKKDNHLKQFYEKIRKKKGFKKAKVATARKMLCQIHLIIKQGKVFYQGQEDETGKDPRGRQGAGTPAFFSDAHK